VYELWLYTLIEIEVQLAAEVVHFSCSGNTVLKQKYYNLLAIVVKFTGNINVAHYQQ
jgi:hypothetical protein